MIVRVEMDAEVKRGIAPSGRTVLLMASLAAVIAAGSHLAYEYLCLAEGYIRIVLH